MLPVIVSFGIAGVWFLLFVGSFLRDRRLLQNGVYLILTLMFAGVGVLFALEQVSDTAARLLVLAVVLAIPLVIAVLAVFLVVNGVTMIRREGRRPANLLSLAAGLGVFAFVGFSVVVQQTGSEALAAIRGALLGILTYVSFLFVCYLTYSLVYGRLYWFRRIDFIVVLGAGIRGTRVPPLLAGRLDRALRLYAKEAGKGRTPSIVTSGGQGPGEDVPEAHAMADHLIERGVPAERVIREDRSISTEQNLAFSRDLMKARNPSYRCLIVTSNFHVFRAAIIARRAKVNGQVVGAPTARYFWPNATLREFAAILVIHRWLNLTVALLITAAAVLPQL